MTTATKPRRKATRSKKGRPAASDFPCCFSELPLRLQDHAIENYRNSRYNYDYDDNDFLQEQLGEVLEYEFGLTPNYRTYQGRDGKQHTGNPEVYWDQYNDVEFVVNGFDTDEVLKHGGDQEALEKEHGTCYYKPEAATLVRLIAEVGLLEVELGVDFDARYDIDEKGNASVEYEWPEGRGDGHGEYQRPPYSDWQWTYNDPEDTAITALFERIEEALEDYYETACSRLKEVIEAEQDWRSSDEYIRETLENSETFEFDEFGDIV